MPTHRGAVLGSSLAVALSGCLDPAGPSRDITDHLTLYSVVQVGSSLVQLLVEQATAGGGRAVEGATAVVQGPHGTLPLLEAAAGPGACFRGAGADPALKEPGCYTGLLPQPAAGGDSLTLEVTLPGGDVVLGALTVPALPVASIPPDSQRVRVPYRAELEPIARVPVQLSSAHGGFRVDVLPIIDSVYLSVPGDAIHPSGCGVSASTAPFRAPPLQGTDDLLVYGVRCLRQGVPLGWDSVDIDVQVISMDENYAGYITHMLCSGVIETSHASLGVDGAFGVFGAVAVTVLQLRLVYDPADVPLPEPDDLPQRYPC